MYTPSNINIVKYYNSYNNFYCHTFLTIFYFLSSEKMFDYIYLNLFIIQIFYKTGPLHHP